MHNPWYINAKAKGNDILLTYVAEDEVRYARIPNYKPTLYIESADPNSRYTELVSGVRLQPKQFDSIKAANQAIRDARDNPHFKLYGNRNFANTFINDNFTDLETSYDVNKIRGFILDIECPADRGFPEPAEAKWPINCMCIYDNITDKYNVWGLNEYNIKTYVDKLVEGGVEAEKVVYKDFKELGEVEMLNDVITYWENNYPAYHSGWNSSSFDLPYMCNRFRRLGLDINRLSPWGTTIIRDDEYNGRITQNVIIDGIADFDYLELYKKNRFVNRESYKLGDIAHIELGTEKVDYSAVADDLRTLHKKDWDLYATYNVIDVAIVKRLEDKFGYFAITLAVAYYAGINYDDVASPVKTWENIFYRELTPKGVILPPKKNNEKVPFEGGYVKPPQVGKHRWVCSFDLNSLYPHLIMGWNISPETLTPIVIPDVNVDTMTERMEYMRPDQDLAVAPSGNTFIRTHLGVAGVQMEKLYKERKSIKREMLVHEQDVEELKAGRTEKMHEFKERYGDLASIEDYLKAAERFATLKDGGQMVRKILLNSFYGALGQIGFCLYDIRLAESVTKSGQLAIRWIGRIINEYLNPTLGTTDYDYVCYTDTDSVYVNMEAVVKHAGMIDVDTQEIVKFLDAYCEDKMIPIIEAGYDDLRDYCNAYSQKMIMAREVISDNAVFCAKKRYAMSVWNSEGVQYDEPYIKMMGLDVIKSSTPAVVRGAMKKTIRMLLNNTEEEVQEFIREFKIEYMKFTPEEIARPAGVTAMEEKYCDANGDFLPVTVYYMSKAAIIYNRTIDRLGLDLERIHPGDKMKYLELEFPNKINNKDIAFPSYLPKEFGIHNRVDYETMWKKSFIKPMDDILNLMGWTSTAVPKLNNLLFS